ncbi:MAG: hypothetical protein QW273_02195 [Candidatus Pacearchaeota archaeon]
MVSREERLNKLKKEYETLSKKYGLPSWKELEDNFEISQTVSKLSEIHIRDIRKKVSGRILGFMQFLESLLSPTTAPLFILSASKKLEEKERIKIRELYKKGSLLELEYIKADLFFNEKKEAELIKSSFEFLEELKKELYPILDTFSKTLEEDKESYSKSYFG